MNLKDLESFEMQKIRGGDWFETTWGVMLGAGLVAGFLGSGGFLALGVVAGGLLVVDGYYF